MIRALFAWLAALALPLATAGSAQEGGAYRAVEHTERSPIFSRASPDEIRAQADLGASYERDRSPGWALAEHRRLQTALAALGPQRPGQADAYVVVVALDSDPVFGREAREAARVLGRRYGAERRTILLAGTDGRADSRQPMGSPANLAAALARVAELMDEREDVLVLYTTSHGARFGLAYHDGDQGYGAISPSRLWGQLSGLNIRNRLLMISACYSGVFVPMLASDTTAIVTAAAADRTSFGCRADSDWTFFGDALINHALRAPAGLEAATGRAQRLIGEWEARGRLEPSNPQVSIGAGARRWLAKLEAALPPATAPVGRPAVTQLDAE